VRSVNKTNTIQLIAERADRLDRYLSTASLEVDPVSRAQVARWIRDGAVSINGQVQLKSAFQVSNGDEITVVLPLPRVVSNPREVSFESLERASVLYHDEDLVIINKSAGLVVHHGSGTSGAVTLVDLLEPLGFKTSAGESGRPGIVHRLDKDTSGIMVVARTALAHLRLSAAFAERRVQKEYCAIVHETPRRRTIFGREDAGIIDQPITRDTTSRTKMKIGEGREAVTEWQVGERFGQGIQLRLFPKTGRTHQIRVHCAFAGAPLLGDRVYTDHGSRQFEVTRIEDRLGRHALHARVLSFPHPRSQTLVTFECPLPADLVECLQAIKALG
jgi:23S rRNA pseudouridine1911/1915/1917 synthase